MTKKFTFEINEDEKKYLLSLAKLAVVKTMKNSFDEQSLPLPPTELLKQELGAFVTLKRHGRLRGCIGNIVSNSPLYLTVARMAVAAAFHDQRFEPLNLRELDDLEYEISVLSPITACKTPEEITIGKHGLVISKGIHQGLLLPQVPVEWKFDRTTFLEQTCHKAGLQTEQWKQAWKDGETELYWFEAVVF